MANYEITYIIRPDASANDVQKLGEGFASVLGEFGAKVVKEESWGLRSLAYKINKQKKGHYVHIGVEGDAAAINELERKFRLSDDIMRFLSIKVDEISQEPTAMVSGDKESKAA